MLAAPARAPAQVLVRSVRRLRALFAARAPAPAPAPPAPAPSAPADPAAAKAAVRARTAARPGVAATATNAGASKPLAAAKSDQQFYLVLERTRRSGAKRLLLEVPLPRPVNPVTRRVLHILPWLVY